MRITYLLPDTPLFGGIKVPLLQAHQLADRGLEVSIAAPGERPDWFPVSIPFVSLPHLMGGELPVADLTVATFWTTIEPAVARAHGPVAHYCQGFEFEYRHNTAEHDAIRRAYAQPIPALAVSSHLATRLEAEFDRPARVVPQPMERAWFSRVKSRLRPARRPRILVLGPFEIDWKGVETALQALAKLRAEGVDFELVRISQWPLPEAESEILPADETHIRIRPEEVREVVESGDLLLAASWEQEGFGLPALEAMARGVPVLASAIPAYRAWAAEAAILVPPRDPSAWADAVQALLGSASEWRRQRRRCLRLARRFHPSRSAAQAEAAMRWAALEGTRGEAGR